MPTQISDLWTPDIWISGITEKQATFPSAMNAGIVTKSDKLNEIASGPGVKANLPFFKDITDQVDEIQVENSAPVSDNGQPADVMVAPILNRVTKNSATALAAGVSGADPVGQIVSQIAERRLKQRQSTLISILRGVLGGGSTAANGAACLSAMRYGGTSAEVFIEDGNAATSDNKISAEVFIRTVALFGEFGEQLARGGIIFCHVDVKTALEKADADGFKTTVAPSELPFEITTYRQIPIFTSMALSRAGTTSGFVYDTFIIGPGVIGIGEKDQQADTVDAASLAFYPDYDKNNGAIFDRTRFLMHVLGTKWTGTPAGQSATNAELATVGNWNLVASTASRCGVALIRTNG